MASLARDSLSFFFSKTGIIHSLKGVRIKRVTTVESLCMAPSGSSPFNPSCCTAKAP